jgi:hypothetical protein
MTDDLPPRLAALIAGERDAPTGDRGRVRAQLSASLGITAPAATATAATATLAGKLVIVALLVGAIGGGTALVVHEPEAKSQPELRPAVIRTAIAPMPQLIATAVPAPVAAAAPVAAPKPRVAPVRVVAPAPAPVATAPVAPAATEDQSTLLARAWSALSRNDAAEALALLDRDADSHPSGPLSEERDALRVDALRRLGRPDDADRSARAFLAQFPDSIHRALVAPALTKETP